MEHGSCTGATEHVDNEQRTLSYLRLKSLSVKLNVEILFFVGHCEKALKQHDFEHNEYEFDLEHDDEQLQIAFLQATFLLSSHEHIDWQDLVVSSCVRLPE